MSQTAVLSETLITLDVGTYRWTPESGLDPAVIVTVDPWTRLAARQLRYPAAQAGLTVADLVQEGRLGALVAARHFNPAYTKWLAYAKKGIRGTMLRALGSRDVSIPADQLQAFRRAGMIPSVGSLDTQAGDAKSPLVDLLNVNGTQVEDAILARRRQRLWAAMETLAPREKAVIIRHHGLVGDAESLERIAADWGISGAGIQRIERLARMRLRAALARLGVTC
jgi:RNA polymerase sigma factor (sigma-70 family)